MRYNSASTKENSNSSFSPKCFTFIAGSDFKAADFAPILLVRSHPASMCNMYMQRYESYLFSYNIFQPQFG